MNLQDIINQKLKSKESKEKYLNILSSRIEENKKTQGKLLFVMAIAVIAFPLLLSAKISEVSIGPIKISDNTFVMSLIPAIFAYAFYQYYTVLFDLSKQRTAYKFLASEIFNIPKESILTRIVSQYSFTESLATYHTEDKSKYLGCLSSLFWIPSVIVMMIFPFVFEVYAIVQIFNQFGLDTFMEWVLFILPILFFILTVFLVIQIVKKDFEEMKE